MDKVNIYSNVCSHKNQILKRLITERSYWLLTKEEKLHHMM